MPLAPNAKYDTSKTLVELINEVFDARITSFQQGNLASIRPLLDSPSLVAFLTEEFGPLLKAVLPLYDADIVYECREDGSEELYMDILPHAYRAKHPATCLAPASDPSTDPLHVIIGRLNIASCGTYDYYCAVTPLPSMYLGNDADMSVDSLLNNICMCFSQDIYWNSQDFLKVSKYLDDMAPEQRAALAQSVVGIFGEPEFTRPAASILQFCDDEWMNETSIEVSKLYEQLRRVTYRPEHDPIF
jgi:hypothetical protein